MKDEDRVFERLKRSPWKTAWDEFILSGDDDSNHHVLERHGWTYEEFVSYGLSHGYIKKLLE